MSLWGNKTWEPAPKRKKKRKKRKPTGKRRGYRLDCPKIPTKPIVVEESPVNTMLEPASLPLPVPPETLPARIPATDPAKMAKRPGWKHPPDSKVRKTAMRIMVMRAAGMEDAEIAKELGISHKSVHTYMYRAGKNGWLDLTDPKDAVEYRIMHKVVRNIEQALDETEDMGRRDHMTLKVAEGTLFKKFGEQSNQQAPTNMLAIKIEFPNVSAETQQVIAENIGGTPEYIEGQVI